MNPPTEEDLSPKGRRMYPFLLALVLCFLCWAAAYMDQNTPVEDFRAWQAFSVLSPIALSAFLSCACYLGVDPDKISTVKNLNINLKDHNQREDDWNFRKQRGDKHLYEKQREGEGTYWGSFIFFWIFGLFLVGPFLCCIFIRAATMPPCSNEEWKLYPLVPVIVALNLSDLSHVVTSDAFEHVIQGWQRRELTTCLFIFESRCALAQCLKHSVRLVQSRQHLGQKPASLSVKFHTAKTTLTSTTDHTPNTQKVAKPLQFEKSILVFLEKNRTPCSAQLIIISPTSSSNAYSNVTRNA